MGMNKKGFTLIEIIVMIVMAGILLPLIIIPFATGIRGSGKPEMVTKAMYYTHQGMEELMKFNFSKTPELDIATNLSTYKNCLTTPTETGYTCQYQVLCVTANDLVNGSLTPSNYKQIHVRVTDPDASTYDVYSVVTNFP
jgi:prepilin-type N-terminal cleavage/methylation domain-containing protein